MELQSVELDTSATEDEMAAEVAARKTSQVAAFTRTRPARKPFPAHLPREGVVVPGPSACIYCGGARLAKLGEDVTETLEAIPRSWKVIQTVREKFTCRDCERISQPPAPFHVTPRGWAVPHRLAMIMFEKFGQHQPLNRQAERHTRKVVPLSLSTLADQVGSCMATIPQCLCWPAARPKSPALGFTCATIAPSAAPPRQRRGFIIPEIVEGNPQGHFGTYTGNLQVDAYGGYGNLYAANRHLESRVLDEYATRIIGAGRG